MNLGPFYLDTKEIFLLVAAVLVALAMALGWNLIWFDRTELFTLIILILVTKGLLPAIHNEAFLFLAIAAIFLTLFLSIFPVVLFYFISFVFFRVLKVI